MTVSIGSDRDGLRQLVRHAEIRPDLHDLGVVLVGLGRIAEPALVAELHVVRAGDIRQRCAQRWPAFPISECVNPPCPGLGASGRTGPDAVCAGCNRARRSAPTAGSSPSLNVVVVARPGSGTRLIRAPAGLGEQPARDRRLPAGTWADGMECRAPGSTLPASSAARAPPRCRSSRRYIARTSGS